MTSTKGRVVVAVLTAALAATSLAGCGRTNASANTNTGGDQLVVGTTDKVVSIDPAGSYDNGSYNVEYNVYSFLMGFAPGKAEPVPDAAQSCGFTADPTVYECKLKSGLKFANGDPLDANAVKFSFDRVLKINDDLGPASLLANLASTTVKDNLTVDFKLKTPNDVTFAQVLASPAGPIVDPKVFSADKLTPDTDIVKANAFSGPYTIGTYDLNQTVQYKPNPDYNGAQGKPQNDGVTVKYYTDETNMKMDIQNGAIDVATRSLTPTDVQTLSKDSSVKVYKGPGGEERFLTFDLKTMPGATDAQKLAVRKAVECSIDRQALATNVYKDTYTPMYSYIPDGLPGANTVLADTYGKSPNKAEAAKFLSDAGVSTPVTLNLEYNSDHYGTSSAEEYSALKSQLESTGLFKVNLQSTEWVTYSQDRVKDAYPIFQLGWFPDFPDPDNYLTPFFDTDNFVKNHFASPQISAELSKERSTTDKASRTAQLDQIQKQLATDYLPTIPLLQGSQVAVAGTNVKGVDKTLDASFQFRYGTLSKS